MEKFKDVLHDFSDVILALLIVVAMFTVISLNLGDWFDDNNVVAIEQQIIAPIDIPEEVAMETEEEEVEEVEEAEESEEATDITEESYPEENQVVDTAIVDSIEITIPNGTPGVGIANILLDYQLIDNAREFVDTAEELNLALQLRSGTFTIPKNATIEDIVRIISRN